MGHFKEVFIHNWYPGLGDQLCLLTAAREFARRNLDCRVHVEALSDVVNAYGDQLIFIGSSGRRIDCLPAQLQRLKDAGPYWNYLGTFLFQLGIQCHEPPELELPVVSVPEGLRSRECIAFQPYSNWAPNPSNGKEWLEELIAGCQEYRPEWPIIMVGSSETAKGLNASYDYLGGPLQMLRVISHAALVLTPRSASAHIAAGYRVPAAVWLPDDGENWHLNYPHWSHRRALFSMEPALCIEQCLKPMLLAKGLSTDVLISSAAR